MKKSILYFCFLLAVPAFGQWQTVYSLSLPSQPELPGLTGVSFSDFNKGMAAGYNGPNGGIIIRTYDNGNHWDTCYISAGSGDFKKIRLLDSVTAVAVGTGIIARTTDFGNNWIVLPVPAYLTCLSFPAANIGYIAGDNDSLLKTFDGGITWTSLPIPVHHIVSSMAFVNDSLGFLSFNGTDTVLKTSNGGSTWHASVPVPGYAPLSMTFSPGGIGYMEIFYPANSYHYVYRTINSGAQWGFMGAFLVGMSFSGIYFPGNDTGYIAGQFNVLKTTDHGGTWGSQSTSPGVFWDEISDACFLNKDTGFIIGYNQFYRTTNGGEPLSTQELALSKTTFTLFPNPSNGQFTLQGNFPAHAHFEIFDTSGRTINDIEIPEGQNDFPVSLDLAAGIYAYKIRDADKVLTIGKFIVTP